MKHNYQISISVDDACLIYVLLEESIRDCCAEAQVARLNGAGDYRAKMLKTARDYASAYRAIYTRKMLR